jgi:hypothetical protein
MQTNCLTEVLPLIYSDNEESEQDKWFTL